MDWATEESGDIRQGEIWGHRLRAMRGITSMHLSASGVSESSLNAGPEWNTCSGQGVRPLPFCNSLNVCASLAFFRDGLTVSCYFAVSLALCSLPRQLYILSSWRLSPDATCLLFLAVLQDVPCLSEHHPLISLRLLPTPDCCSHRESDSGRQEFSGT